MKAKDFINEVFDSKVDGQVVRATNDLFTTKATIGGRIITFNASNYETNTDEPMDAWEIEFTERPQGKTQGHTTYGKSGSGSELQVFSFVIDSIKELIHRYSPQLINFTSDKADGNRSSLYRRIAGKINIPGYKLAPVDTVGNSDIFNIIRDK